MVPRPGVVGTLPAGVERLVVTLFLCGDVMLGRGVDQVLAHPGEPALRERYVQDARTYVELAEAVNGPVPRPVGWSWPWGDALALLEDAAPDVRVVNLETSITRSDDFAPGKAVHYRMSPDNLPALSVARPDVCVLANNHVLDFGRRGLAETLDVLSRAGLRSAGAGHDAGEARAPAVVPGAGGRGGVVVVAFGTTSSGIPPGWAAAPGRPGVELVADLSDAEVDAVCDRAQAVRQPSDVVVASVHWGSNWGYDVEPDQVRFAHRLVDGGVDVVHGHSSHHPRPVEVYRGGLVLYGCGDLVDDYEGITGHERFRADLRLLYLAEVDPDAGGLVSLRMVPLQARRLRLHRASRADAEWLRGILDSTSRRFGVRVGLAPDGLLAVRPG
jgi:poly-gamma-glutamate capsule biosynthesis protein CapA/YwtB (metallophosphatase superfamily)